MIDINKYYTLTEYANHSNVTRQYIFSLIKDKRLSSVMVHGRHFILKSAKIKASLNKVGRPKQILAH